MDKSKCTARLVCNNKTIGYRIQNRTNTMDLCKDELVARLKNNLLEVENIGFRLDGGIKVPNGIKNIPISKDEANRLKDSYRASWEENNPTVHEVAMIRMGIHEDRTRRNLSLASYANMLGYMYLAYLRNKMFKDVSDTNISNTGFRVTESMIKKDKTLQKPLGIKYLCNLVLVNNDIIRIVFYDDNMNTSIKKAYITCVDFKTKKLRNGVILKFDEANCRMEDNAKRLADCINSYAYSILTQAV